MAGYTLLQFTESMDSKGVEEYALRLESYGYDGIWVPEVSGREPMALAGYLLAKTTRINIGVGIANVYARDFVAAAQARQTLAELSGGRFWLGLGVSHPVLVEPRGHKFIAPTQAMGNYLKGIHATKPDGLAPTKPAPIICAAHGPKLLGIAREHADGALIVNQPPEHTARARSILGPDKKLCAMVRVCFETDETRAMQLARDALNFYVTLPAYHRTWKHAGFDDSDFENGGSDRLVRSIFALGDIASVRKKIQEHVDAGADEIGLYPINPREQMQPGQVGGLEPDWDLLEALAPAHQ